MTNHQTPPFREVTAVEAVALARDGFRVIDVREQSEWDAGHVAGATLLPLGELAERIGEVAPDKDARCSCSLRGRRPLRARGRPAGRDGLHQPREHEGADRPLEGAGRPVGGAHASS